MPWLVELLAGRPGSLAKLSTYERANWDRLSSQERLVRIALDFEEELGRYVSWILYDGGWLYDAITLFAVHRGVRGESALSAGQSGDSWVEFFERAMREYSMALERLVAQVDAEYTACA